MLKAFIIICLFLIDLISKQYILYLIPLNSFLSITSFFDIAHIHNFGISFGLLSGFFSYWLFAFIGIIVTIFLCIMYFQSTSILEKWGFIIIISGALSNIFDRLINGFVVDFIYFHYQEFFWPAFNFADIYITTGVLIIVLHILKNLHKKIIK